MQSAKWPQIEELFQRVLDAEDPQAIIAQEPDPEVAEAVRHLWRNYLAADASGFLEQPVETVRDLLDQADEQDLEA
jgi:hypothetical protein